MGWIEYRLVWAGITNSVLELATPFLSSNFQSFKIAHWAFFLCPRQSPTSRTKDHQLRQHVTANKTLFSQHSFASSSSRKQHHFNGSETNTLLHTLYQSPSHALSISNLFLWMCRIPDTFSLFRANYCQNIC